MRMIDADKLLQELRKMEVLSLDGRDLFTGPARIAVFGRIGEQPTLTPPNEWVTLEEVAEILAEQFGDECACNVNGNDEWLPMMCHYGDVCPDPPEHLGCWMELLRNKYRRPPEGEEDT